mmetsp:Transcript_49584/g.99502  ORF Transcript_49584/g.99502 Transcript_49584/m.99502 type:complete len:273 (+) Transcript_49584:84-902(+)
MAEKTGKGFAPTAAQSLRKGYNNLLGSFKSKPSEMAEAESQEDLVKSFNFRSIPKESDSQSISALSDLSSEETPRQRANISMLSNNQERPHTAAIPRDNEDVSPEEKKMLEEQLEMMKKESEVRQKLSAEEEQLKWMRQQQLEFIRRQNHAEFLRRPDSAPQQATPRTAKTSDRLQASGSSSMPVEARSENGTSRKPLSFANPKPSMMRMMMASNKVGVDGAALNVPNGETLARRHSTETDSPKRFAWSSFSKRGSDPGHFDEVKVVTPRKD